MNDYNERLLENVIDDYYAAKDEEYLKEIENAKSDPLFANTEATDKKYEKIIKSVKRKRRIKKDLFRAASIAVILAVGLTVAAFTVDGFRERAMELISSIRGQSHSGIFASEDENLKKLADYEGEYFLSWIPEGYGVENVENPKTYSIVNLKNKIGNVIVYNEFTVIYNQNYDSEKINEYNKVNIDGFDAAYVKKEDKMSIIMIKLNNKVITISTDDENIDLTELAKFIEKR